MNSPRAGATEGAQGEWTLSNDEVSLVVSAPQGADIRSIIHRASGTELLWRDPSGAPARPLASTQRGSDEFYDRYPGGIQELFPNAGPDCDIDGAPLVFHGESCRIPWTVAAGAAGDYLECSASLRRYPFDVRRTISLAGSVITVESTVTNSSATSLPVHWGFHPVFSEALTAEPAVLLGDFSTVIADPAGLGAVPTWEPSATVPLETRHGFSALPLVPENNGSAGLAYADAGTGWFVVHSERIGMAVGLAWQAELFPRLWIWQECRDPAGYPWWGRHHIVGVEPHTASPVRSLTADVDAGQALDIEPGGSRTARVRIHVGAIVDENVASFAAAVSRSATELQGAPL